MPDPAMGRRHTGREGPAAPRHAAPGTVGPRLAGIRPGAAATTEGEAGPGSTGEGWLTPLGPATQHRLGGRAATAQGPPLGRDGRHRGGRVMPRKDATGEEERRREGPPAAQRCMHGGAGWVTDGAVGGGRWEREGKG